MRPGNIPADIVFAHIGDKFDQGRFQLAGVVDGEITVLVMDDPVRRAFAESLFHQQAVGCKLKDMRVVRLGVYQIWLMNADGTEQKQIVRSGVQYSDYLPEWSPKNDLIIFNQRCATKFCNPYLMSISATDHSSEQGLRLPISIAFIENIDYSPDGFYIAYEGVGEAGNMDIFYMTLSGGDRVRLSTDPAQDFQPTWRPATPEP